MGNRCLSAILATALCIAPVAVAQSDPHSNVFLGSDRPKDGKEKAPVFRNVRGTVTDDAGKPLDNAMVTLTNEDTHERLTFFTKNGGRYNFDGLRFTTDYKLEAQFKDNRSAIKTLSQYDRQPNPVRILEVVTDPQKQAKQ